MKTHEVGRMRRRAAALAKGSGALLGVALTARLAAGYIARGWQRLRRKRDLSVDVIAPKFGPALVVSTEDFEDEYGHVLADEYHTRTFLSLTRLEIVRKIAVGVSLLGILISFLLWMKSKTED